MKLYKASVLRKNGFATPSESEKPARTERLFEGLDLRGQAGRVTLAGPRVDDALVAELCDWLLSMS